MINKNYEFFIKIDLSGYIGEWIAICNEKIVSHGKDVKKVYREAREKHPTERSLLTRVPEKQTTIFPFY